MNFRGGCLGVLFLMVHHPSNASLTIFSPGWHRCLPLASSLALSAGAGCRSQLCLLYLLPFAMAWTTLPVILQGWNALLLRLLPAGILKQCLPNLAASLSLPAGSKNLFGLLLRGCQKTKYCHARWPALQRRSKQRLQLIGLFLKDALGFALTFFPAQNAQTGLTLRTRFGCTTTQFRLRFFLLRLETILNFGLDKERLLPLDLDGFPK